MLNIKTLSILAIAGTAVAAPQGWGNWAGNYFSGGRNGGDNNSDNDSGKNQQVDVDVVTAYTTVTHRGNWNWGGNQGGQPSSTSAPAMQTWAPVNDQPAAAPEAPASSGSSGGYMGVVNEYRSKMGLSQLTESSTLVGNADKTARDGNGQMVHQLNPGSFAQVLAPGSPSEFEKVFVGGWLCERPSLPGLNGICSSMSQGWAYDGQTGHADILSSSKYSKIGCACETGIWSCDLA